MRLSRSKAFLWRKLEGRYPPTAENLALADQAMTLLWQERQREKGQTETTDRSGSCKFAALLARELFGGALAGNYDHVFVIRAGAVLDLNANQADVVRLGAAAHEIWPEALFRREYGEALQWNIPRVERWVEWFVNNAACRELPEPLTEHTAQ